MKAARVGLAILMIGSGILHFAVPDPYVRIVPSALPAEWALPLVYVSGAMEVAGGAGVLIAATRRVAGWFLAALLVAVFPANVQMAVDTPNIATILRLPLQVPLVWLAWRQTRPVTSVPPTAASPLRHGNG